MSPFTVFLLWKLLGQRHFLWLPFSLYAQHTQLVVTCVAAGLGSGSPNRLWAPHGQPQRNFSSLVHTQGPAGGRWVGGWRDGGREGGMNGWENALIGRIITSAIPELLVLMNLFLSSVDIY